MSVSLRLRRIGSKKQPFYRIVAIDKRKARNASSIERIGFYNPLKKEDKFFINKEMVFKWLKYGAQPTLTVRKIFTHAGIMVEWEKVRQTISSPSTKKRRQRKNRMHPMAEKLKLRAEQKKKDEIAARYRQKKQVAQANKTETPSAPPPSAEPQKDA